MKCLFFLFCLAGAASAQFTSTWDVIRFYTHPCNTTTAIRVVYSKVVNGVPRLRCASLDPATMELDETTEEVRAKPTTPSNNRIYKQPLTPSPDGVVATFALVRAPNPVLSLTVVCGGVEQRAGVDADFLLAANGLSITFKPEAVPRAGTWCHYSMD